MPVDEGVVPFDSASCERYRGAGWWTGRSLPEDLLAAAGENAGRVALVTPRVTWTYGELFDRARCFAAGLATAGGVAAGEPVMFQMGNIAETIVSYLGCLLAAAKPVCTLPQHGVREIGLLAEHVGARCLVSQGSFRRGAAGQVARKLVEQGSVERVVLVDGEPFEGAVPYGEVLDAGRGLEQVDLPYLRVNPGTVAVFQLSGGTTGLPKVAPRLHEEYAYNSRAWAQALAYGPDTVLFYPLPVMHNAGISLAVQPAILSGARLVLAPSADDEQMVRLIREHRPDVLPLVPPAVAIRLLDFPGITAADVASIEDFVVGGQKLPEEVSVRLRDELGIRVRQMFGMAEGMFLLTPEGASERLRFGTVGAPISPGDEIRVLDPGSEDEVPDGQVGEMAARGPYTIRGYYRAEQHNRSSFTCDGFYRTGDLARRHVTPDGTFYSIEGRIKDVINRGVEKIHAEEVEEIIVQHPGVRTAALVAMPDPVLGERVCAYLEMQDGAAPLTVATLGEFLLSFGLARYKLPERVEIVSALPLTNVGKVSKKALRDDIQRKYDAESEENA